MKERPAACPTSLKREKELYGQLPLCRFTYLLLGMEAGA
jgi:hypothetical protein